MSYALYLALTLATTGRDDLGDAAESTPARADVLEPALGCLRAVAEGLRRGPVSPLVAAQFEKALQQATRALGRVVTPWASNHAEPAVAAALPRAVHFEGSSCRRLAQQTPQQVSTWCGTITRQRFGYRAAPSEGEPVLVPLCRTLGLVQGTTPAWLERIACYLAESGATPKRPLARLRQEHGVAMGVKRLRQLLDFVAAAREDHRTAAPAAQVLRWLEQAQASRGRQRPVLSAGRDGITLGVRLKGCARDAVATTGTLTVSDRRGRRLGTVSLAQPPEPGQGTRSRHLTQLLHEVCRRWSGPLPRLGYVTDAGDNETSYDRKELRRRRQPVTGQRLNWCWVVDYDHASQRLWTRAEALFGVGQRSWCWARKLQKLLLQPGGVGRVGHSAAAVRSRSKLTGKRLADFKRAYPYLQGRRQQLRYAASRQLGLPIGSGVTEAACKTVSTQRVQRSGRHWHKDGAHKILRLRVILWSGIWSQV